MHKDPGGCFVELQYVPSPKCLATDKKGLEDSFPGTLSGKVPRFWAVS